jgi:hypothetical protein
MIVALFWIIMLCGVVAVITATSPWWISWIERTFYGNSPEDSQVHGDIKKRLSIIFVLWVACLVVVLFPVLARWYSDLILGR